MTQLPLEGVKVADFSWFGAGPICGRLLADYGATRVTSNSSLESIGTNVTAFATTAK